MGKIIRFIGALVGIPLVYLVALPVCIFIEAVKRQGYRISLKLINNHVSWLAFQDIK